MLYKWKSLLMPLIALAIGVAQTVGIHSGYICECTGEISTLSICEADDCHPQQSHDKSHCDNCTGHDLNKEPTDHDHEHGEVKDDLLVANVSTTISIPSPLFNEFFTNSLTITFGETRVFETWQNNLFKEPCNRNCQLGCFVFTKTMVMLI
jgi:hypothetical protein